MAKLTVETPRRKLDVTLSKVCFSVMELFVGVEVWTFQQTIKGPLPFVGTVTAKEDSTSLSFQSLNIAF